MRPIKDHTGNKYGRLTAIRLVERCPKKRHKWLFSCECGNEKVIAIPHVVAGNIQSCGCLQRERAALFATKHGLQATHAREYGAWIHIKGRCGNPNNQDFRYYGGRGIRVCDRWANDFAAFMADMGPAPDGFSIDRIDNNGNYEPANCRWADRVTQMNNRRSNRRIEIGDQTKNLSEWCKESGVGVATAIYRIKTGRDPDQVFANTDYRK
jgi:hypothetical protein